MLRTHTSTKLLSMLLVVCMVFGLAANIFPNTLFASDAEAVYHEDNAPTASLELLASTEDSFYVADSGASFRIIDGELYSWGSNSAWLLGYETYNGVACTEKTSVNVPTLVTPDPKYTDGWGSDVVKVGADSGWRVMALTEKGDLFMWGSQNCWYYGSTYYKENYKVPTKLDTSEITALNDKIVDYCGGNVGCLAITEQGRIFVTGEANYVNMLTGVNYGSTHVFHQVGDSFVDMLQASWDGTTVTDASQRVGGANRRTISRVWYSGGSFTAYFLMSDNTLYTRGNAACGAMDGNTSNHYTPGRPLDAVENLAFQNAGPQWETMVTTTSSSNVIDASGCVWSSGSTPLGSQPFPIMVYDANFYGAKCIKIFASGSSRIFLTEDNSLYAIGVNANQYITTEQDKSTIVTTPTQIFTDLSAQKTITGVYVTGAGVTVLTKSGDQYFAGDNTNGLAGNGTNENAEAGEIIQAVAPDVPPVQPLTANELIFEIETADGYRYRYNPAVDSATNPDGHGITVISPEAGIADTTTNKTLRLNAGALIKLNIYFNDFGRLNAWEIPVRFDPTYLQVVRGDGTPYETDRTVTPGALGDSVGIVKQFTNSQWSGGAMVGPSVKSGGYPKICNGEGWVSVAGYSADKTAKIDGEVKMCTIYFTAVGSMGNATSFLTIANNGEDTDSGKQGLGYDGSMTAADKGALWSVLYAGEDGPDGYFKFAYNKDMYGDLLSPAFSTSVTDVQNLTLVVKSSDGAAISPADYSYEKEEGSYTSCNGAQISNSNKVGIYTVETLITSADWELPASFPEVDWTCSILHLPKGETVATGVNNDPTDPNYGNRVGGTWLVSDFITILSENTSQVKFKISEDYPLEDGKPRFPVVLEFRAKTQVAQSGVYKENYIYVILRDYEPPVAVQITEHATLTDDTVVWTDINDEDVDEVGRTFTCDFPGSRVGFDQLDVIWTLMDSSRNVLTGLSTDYAKLSTPVPSNSGKYLEGIGDEENDPSHYAAYTAPSVKVEAQHTTFGDEYFILRVESAYDGSIYDEIKIKIHQRVTGITWKKNTLYTVKGGDNVDLKTMVTVSPENECYSYNLNFVHKPNTSNTGNPFIYVNSGGMLQPLRASIVNGSSVFDQVYVTDTVSGYSSEQKTQQDEKYLKVYVISVESPLKAEDVVVYNLLGTKSDYARVYNLMEGDSIVFFKDYADCSGKVPSVSTKANCTVNDFNTALTTTQALSGQYKRFNNLTAEQIGAQGIYDFPLPDFLSGTGGDLGVVIIRDGDHNDTAEPYDMIPVHYISDPSKVYGYVQLYEREPNSAQNRNISVKLVGPSTPAAITTGANGYFVFQEYIIPGEYTMTISKDGYLTRTIQADAATGYRGIVITEALEFAISTYENPIYLYPGDLDNNGSINASDISNYVRNWYGQNDYINIYDFAKYDFYELDGQNAINMYDLNAVMKHNGWSKTNYAKWNVPTVS